MQIKVYVPKVIEVPSEYLPALARRAADSLGEHPKRCRPLGGTWCARPCRMVCFASSTA